jgi:hypothetical protein
MVSVVGSDVRAEVVLGPALLVTNGCDLDKPRSKRADAPPRIERLQFLALADLAQQDATRQQLARKRELAPAEVVYVGEVPGVGEAFGLLSEMYYLPAELFDLELRTSDHEAAERGKRLAHARSHGSRVGRLSAKDVDLLGLKMAAFWPRLTFDASSS